MSLNVRVLRHLLSQRTPGSHLREAFSAELTGMLNRAPELQTFERESLSDDEVRQFILSEFRQNSAPSRTGTLRHLRDSGFRCEEKRFKKLYQQLRSDID